MTFLLPGLAYLIIGNLHEYDVYFQRGRSAHWVNKLARKRGRMNGTYDDFNTRGSFNRQWKYSKIISNMNWICEDTDTMVLKEFLTLNFISKTNLTIHSTTAQYKRFSFLKFFFHTILLCIPLPDLYTHVLQCLLYTRVLQCIWSPA